MKMKTGSVLFGICLILLLDVIASIPHEQAWVSSRGYKEGTGSTPIFGTPPSSERERREATSPDMGDKSTSTKPEGAREKREALMPKGSKEDEAGDGERKRRSEEVELGDADEERRVDDKENSDGEKEQNAGGEGSSNSTTTNGTMAVVMESKETKLGAATSTGSEGEASSVGSSTATSSTTTSSPDVQLRRRRKRGSKEMEMVTTNTTTAGEEEGEETSTSTTATESETTTTEPEMAANEIGTGTTARGSRVERAGSSHKNRPAKPSSRGQGSTAPGGATDTVKQSDNEPHP